MKKKKTNYEGPGKPVNREFNGRPVFRDEDGRYFVDSGASRFYCGERRFDKLGTAQKIEDEKRAEQTRIHDEAVAKQREEEKSVRAK